MFICTDDDSRVLLQRNNDSDSDYINASYIDVRSLIKIITYTIYTTCTLCMIQMRVLDVATYVDIKESHKLYVCIEISDENVMDMLSS